MNKAVLILWTVVAGLFCSLPAYAEIVTAQGAAAIKPAGIERARQLAILDARNQAAQQAGMAIEMASTTNPRGLVLESSRVRSAATIGNATVIREWQSGDYLHVQVEVEVEAPARLATANLKYKKKLTATPFPVRKAAVTDDIDNVSHGIANELLRRLEDGGRFLGRNSEYTLPVDGAGQHGKGESVMRLASMHDSQFVIAGEIIDASISREGGYLGVFERQRRRFEIDVFVYDGLTGSLLARHRIEKSVMGDVKVGRDKPFASASFLATGFGQAISKALDEAVALISRDLARLPFSARIVRVDGDRIYIDAGSTSLVAPGDKLVAYRLSKELPLTGYGSGSGYGVSEIPVATVTIAQVQPKFSVGTLSSSASGVAIEAGDLVRFDLESGP